MPSISDPTTNLSAMITVADVAVPANIRKPVLAIQVRALVITMLMACSTPQILPKSGSGSDDIFNFVSVMNC